MARNNRKNNDEISEGVFEYEQKKGTKRKNSLNREEFIKCGVELSVKQNELYKGIRNNNLSIAQGPAGSSKTFTSCYAALALLSDKKVDRIVITKPIQESGENIGFLKGSLEEKLDPYKQSYYTNFCKIIGKTKTDWLFATEEIKFEPLAYMRGSTYDNCVMILDEAQNSSMKQIILWVTRLGNDSKGILLGDISQYDVKKKDSGLLDFIEMVDGMEGSFNFKFENGDIVRNKFLIDLTNRYDKYRSTRED